MVSQLVLLVVLETDLGESVLIYQLVALVVCYLVVVVCVSG